MRHRFFGVARVVVFGTLAALCIAGFAAGQTPSSNQGAAAAKSGSAPKTPWGEPDLQGIWSNATVTPLQRPPELANREFLTDAEAAAFEQRIAAQRVDAPPEPGSPGTYNQHWFDRGTKVAGTRRTSLIVDPPDGRLPAYTAEAKTRVEAEAAARDARLTGKAPFNTFTDLDPGERCITDGLPMLPYAYNNNYHIAQSPGYVVILHEMFHDHRIIPTDGRPHVGKDVRQWMGDPRGRWEGNTLVVESTNFSDAVALTSNPRGAGRNLRIVERFTRVSPTALEYRFTVEDPTTFTKPWSGVVSMTTDQAAVGATQGALYEYACHEGNYAVPNSLAGGRAMDKEAAAKKGSN